MFLSYARSTEEQATYAERALREAGYVVWRDTELPAHLSYADVIEERLKSAKAVLVLWSAEAAKSQWVRAEADAARELGTLIQSSVDGTVPPIPFNQIQCADLSGWHGESDHNGWRKLLASVVALAGQAEAPAKAARKQRPASSVCVLSFQNMSSDDVPDYFCDGIAEDVMSELTKLSGLSVTPRKSAFAFKGPDVDAFAVAEKLGVGHVVEGTVRRAGNKVRITAQLVDGTTGEQTWADRYYRDFTDIFSIQEEIAQAIAGALRGKLLPADKKPAAEDAGDAAPAAAAKTVKLPEELRAEPAPAPPASLPPVEAPPSLQSDVQEAPLAAPVAEIREIEPAAPQVQTSAPEYYHEPEPEPEQWAAQDEYWQDEDWEEDEGRKRRNFLTPELAPRLIALGVVLLIAALVAFYAWPSKPKATVHEEHLTYTVISPVNVRSLPTQYGSRILGKLKPGEKINIVPALAGAQPDWIKIEDGAYVGGYVWRESTRPASEVTEADLAEAAKPAKHKKKADAH